MYMIMATIRHTSKSLNNYAGISATWSETDISRQYGRHLQSRRPIIILHKGEIRLYLCITPDNRYVHD